MYEPSRGIASFHIAGFKHWDGALALGHLKVGDRVEIEPEPDNPYDPSALALRFQGFKLGFVPRADNEIIAAMCHYGHGDVFECRVLKVDPAADPWKQVMVGIFISDAR